VDTKAEAFIHHVLTNLVPTTTTKECSNKWAECTVRISGDPTSIPKTRQTTKQNFASTSYKTRAPTKESVASLMATPNLDRSSPCNSSLILRDSTKTMEIKVHNKTMALTHTKSNRFKYLCKEITCLRTRITTTDSNISSSGNKTME
jgi:hypothetical protein